MLGAPIVGETSEWADRSQLWDAVLFDHAQTGYLEMPAKGGRMDLPDDLVKAAAEYMLEVTFPDRLHDCNPPSCTEDGDVIPRFGRVPMRYAGAFSERGQTLLDLTP